MDNAFRKLNICILTYAIPILFSATNDGELTVVEGDELVVLEQDTDNSGWTKVLKDDEEGYVPSTYIEYV